MDLRLTEIQEAARDTARDLAEKKLLPAAAKLDATEDFPDAALKDLAELGLLGLRIPEAHGGAALDMVSYALTLMEIARADASVAVTLSVNNLVAETIERWASSELKDTYLRRMNEPAGLGAFALTEPHAGSDAAAIRTRAELKGNHWVLNGEKTWITSADRCGVMLVVAVTDPTKKTKGLSAFLVEGNAKGMTVGKHEPKMGQRASHSCPVFFKDCKVPTASLLGKEGEGLKVALSGLDSGRIGIASLSTGLNQACLEEMTRYAKDRSAFGKPIADFQAIQWMIADTAVDLEASRSLTLAAAWLKDAGQPIGEKAAMAKLFASEAANRSAYRATQVFGGYGYSREYRVERLYRDARVLTLYEGTSEIQRLVIARGALK